MEDVHTSVVTLWAAISAHAGMVIYWTLTELVAMVSKRKDDDLYSLCTMQYSYVEWSIV